MQSLNQIVGIVSERTGRAFDIPYQEILKELASTIRAKFMKDSLTKRPNDRKYYLQSFVAPVIRVNKIECPISYGCTLRTKDEIPQPLRANNILFEFVGSADFDIPFAEGGEWKERFFKHNLYTSKEIRFKYKDNYIFLADQDSAIEYIGVEGIFEDAFAVRKFKCKSADGLCDADDAPYPMPADLVEPLIKEILSIIVPTINAKEETEIKVDEKSGE